MDLFGAERADLPSIWKELVDAGFESGHAYGRRSLYARICGLTDSPRQGASDREVMRGDDVVSLRCR